MTRHLFLHDKTDSKRTLTNCAALGKAALEPALTVPCCDGQGRQLMPEKLQGLECNECDREQRALTSLHTLLRGSQEA